MPEKVLRKRIPSSGSSRKIRPPHPSPSPTRRSPIPRPPIKHSKPIKFLKRCLSEPVLKHTVGCNEPVIDCELFHRNRTCTNDFASSPSLISFYAPDQSIEGLQRWYNKESKVVVNVTVEGSPGAVRTMLKLGSTVEQTIKLVVHKYSQQRTTPKLDTNSSSSSSSYELHDSHFSLQSLDKAEVIGDIGSRSFYLRRSSSSSNGPNSPCLSQNVLEAENSRPPVQPPVFLHPSFFGPKLAKIIRRSRRLLKVLICWK